MPAAETFPCGDQPCRPLSEGQLKGVQLGMSLEEAIAAFPELKDAETQEPERISAVVDVLNPMGFIGASRHAIPLPGLRFALETTLLDQPALCDFQFASAKQVSRLHCALTQTAASVNVHERLTQTLEKRLTSQYGPGRDIGSSDNIKVSNFVKEDWSQEWGADGDTLVMRSTFEQIMGLPPSSTLEITFTSQAHAAVVARLQAEVQEAQQVRQAEKEREAAEEARRLGEQLADPNAGAGDL